MDWGSIVGGLVGGLGGALIGAVVSLITSGRQLRRVDEHITKIEQPRLQIELERLEMDRSAESKARERAAHLAVMGAFQDMTDWINRGIDKSPRTEAEALELLAKYNRAADLVSIDGHPDVRYFVVDTARSFHVYVDSVLMGSPIEDFRDRFINGQRAVQQMVRHRQQLRPPSGGSA